MSRPAKCPPPIDTLPRALPVSSSVQPLRDSGVCLGCRNQRSLGPVVHRGAPAHMQGMDIHGPSWAPLFRFSLQCPPLECHLPPSRANIIPYSRCRQAALLFKCFHRRSTWSWGSPSSLFELDLYPRLTGNQPITGCGLIRTHKSNTQWCRVTPSPLGRAPSSCTPRPNLDRAHHSRARHHLCERRAARFVDSGIAACRPLETVHFPSPNSSSPHPLALASAPIIGKLAKARLLALGPPQAMPVCLLPIDPQAIDSAAVGPFATETPALLSDPRPSLCRTDDLSHGSLPGGSRCLHMRAREPQLRFSRSPVSLVHQPRATRPSPHISTSQFSEMLVHPHGPPLGLHVWRDRQCFRHAARPMRQTANVIVAASHPQITERLHPPFWPRLQLDTLLRPCVKGAARCRGAHAPMSPMLPTSTVPDISHKAPPISTSASTPAPSY